MREREGEWRGEGERERAREEQGQRERERERRKWLVVTHARFFRQTAFLKIFPPVAACRFKSPGRSRRFSNAPNTACTSLRRAPPIATASNIFFPFFIRLFFYFLFFFSSTLSFFSFFSFIPPLPFHTSLSLVVAVLIFRGKNSQGRANIFFSLLLLSFFSPRNTMEFHFAARKSPPLFSLSPINRKKVPPCFPPGETRFETRDKDKTKVCVSFTILKPPLPPPPLDDRL